MALTISSTVQLNNGVAMPLFGLGTWRMDEPGEARAAVRSALELGYRLIDTAAAYGNEQEIGSGVRESGVDRREVFLTSKVWIDEQGYDATIAACHESLRRLQTDYLDLYLIHWPMPQRWQRSWDALLQLQEDGYCLAVGVSNFDIPHLEEMLASSPAAPAVNQVEFSPFLYQHELLEFCGRHDIQLEGYSPLAHGARLQHPVLRQLAEKYGKTPAQLLIRWPLQHGVVTIPKSSHPARIRQNAEVFDFEITPEDMAALDGLNENYYTSEASWRARFGLP